MIKTAATTTAGPVQHVVCNECGARDDGFNQGGGLTPCEICGPKQNGTNLNQLYLTCADCTKAHQKKHAAAA